MSSVIPNEARSSRLLSLIATILVVAVLYLAREVLVPIALAVLLSFLLFPLVARLQRWGLKRIPAVLVVSMMAFGAIAAVGYVMTVETVSLAESLPQYRQNIREKVRTLASPGMFSRATESIRQTTEEVIRATTQPEESGTSPAVRPRRTEPVPAGPEAGAEQPVRVEIAEPRPNSLEAIAHSVQPLLGPLGTAGIIVVFVIFMLIQREDLRDRLVALTGAGQINVTTAAFDDASQRVSRYLLMQFIVNGTYGLAVAIGLAFIGIPNAWLWGTMCAILRYIPYVGPWLGAAMPILLSLAVFDGWTRPLMVIGLFVIIEVISNNAIEPWLYGSGTGVSSMAVLFAAVFWTWLWGMPGLILSTPMTVCLVVIGRHIPQMRWLVVLLGEEPGLPLPQRVYQRLLAADHDAVIALAEDHLKDHTLLQWYDHVLIPALSMAELDRHEGKLDERREQAAFAAAREVIEELGDSAAENDAAKADDSSSAPPAVATESTKDESRPLILIAAAHDEADELAAIMLAQLLEQQNQRVQVLPSGTLAGESSEHAAAANPAIICISSMPPMAVGHARYKCKRMHERLPQTRLVVGVWNASDPERAAQRMHTVGVETVAVSFAKAIELLRM